MREFARKLVPNFLTFMEGAGNKIRVKISYFHADEVRENSSARKIDACISRKKEQISANIGLHATWTCKELKKR